MYLDSFLKYRAGFGLKVRLGEWDAKANVEPLKYVELGVTRVKVNPFFNRANLQNDIAVLTLEQPVNLASTPHINPVCPSNFQANYVGRRYVLDKFEAMSLKIGFKIII
jgi:hypothetical protein